MSKYIDTLAKALAFHQGVDWTELHETDVEQERYRSPDCCNRLDCKDDIRGAVRAVLDARRKAGRKR